VTLLGQGVGWGIPRGPSQPRPFCDSVRWPRRSVLGEGLLEPPEHLHLRRWACRNCCRYLGRTTGKLAVLRVVVLSWKYKSQAVARPEQGYPQRTESTV